MPARFEGTVRGQGQFYADGREIQYVAIQKSAAPGFPYREGERVDVELEVNGQSFAAGVLTTPAQPIVYISSDLLDSSGAKISLAAVLEAAGLTKGQRVIIDVQGTRLLLNAFKS